MHVQEVIGRWQAQEGQRSIAHAMGIARVTVRRYIGHAKKLGIMHSGPPPSEAQLVELGTCGTRGSGARARAAQQHPPGAVYRDAGLQVSRIHELLNHELAVSYSSLRRIVVRAKRLVPRTTRTTVRVAPSAAGEIAEMDFGRLGTLVHSETGACQTVWAMAVVLPVRASRLPPTVALRTV